MTETRIKVLRTANQLSDSADMGEVKEQSYQYYKRGVAAISLEATGTGKVKWVLLLSFFIVEIIQKMMISDVQH